MVTRLKGPYRIYVLTSSDSQFEWALDNATERDQEKMVRVRGAWGLRGLTLNPGDELWVLGFDGHEQEVEFDANFRIGRWAAWQVLNRRVCKTCESMRRPWDFRLPYQGDQPQTRLRQCYDCELRAQRERDQARRLVHRQVVEEEREDETGDDTYTQALAEYLERRRKGETRYV